MRLICPTCRSVFVHPERFVNKPAYCPACTAKGASESPAAPTPRPGSKPAKSKEHAHGSGRPA